jgi:hypothetical protein
MSILMVLLISFLIALTVMLCAVALGWLIAHNVGMARSISADAPRCGDCGCRVGYEDHARGGLMLGPKCQRQPNDSPSQPPARRQWIIRWPLAIWRWGWDQFFGFLDLIYQIGESEPR